MDMRPIIPTVDIKRPKGIFMPTVVDADRVFRDSAFGRHIEYFEIPCNGTNK